MNRIVLFVLAALVPLMAADEGWISLFNGKDLTGWRVNENPGTFTVKDGAIVASGPRSHCFYVGDVGNHSFTQFELRVEVMTQPKANGGIYIMTDFQAQGWPGAGFEVQVNNSFPGDFRKTGSLYQVEDIKEQLVKDNEWFTEHIIVKGNTITVRSTTRRSSAGHSRRTGRAPRSPPSGVSGRAPSRCRAMTPEAPRTTGTSRSGY